MEESDVEKAVKAMFEAADNASKAGVVVDWRSTCVTVANSLLQEIGRLEQEVKRLEEAVSSEQEAMREVLEAETLIDKD